MTNENHQNTEEEIQELKEKSESQKKSESHFKAVLGALKIVFSDPLFLFLGISLTVNLLALYYFVFLQTTTFYIFWQSNSAFYNIASITLAVVISVFFGITMSFVAWQWRQNKEKRFATSGNSFIGAFLGAVSTGCPVCGAFLVSIIGIGGGLAAFPFQGLEIKAISLFLLSYSIIASSKSIPDKTCVTCEVEEKEKLLKIDKGHFVFTFKKETLKPLQPLAIGIGALLLVIYLPVIGNKLGTSVAFQPNSQAKLLAGTAQVDSSQINSSDLLEQVNPSSGYTINAVYGDIGPKLLASGAIDFERFKTLYERSGQPLTSKQIKLLTEGSNEKISINQDNAYFLINFLWALGLANQNPILDEGPLTKYGFGKIGNFASTGGWTLGTKPATDLYSKSQIIPLNKKEQDALDDFANNSYRPCCNNSTAFADCNHGMAALGLGEIMAASGVTADEMFEAQKYFNAFWFPQQYLDLAKYFKIREVKDWNEVDSRVAMGKDYSTASGWSRARNWLASNNATEKVPSSGGGCGV